MLQKIQVRGNIWTAREMSSRSNGISLQMFCSNVIAVGVTVTHLGQMTIGNRTLERSHYK